MRTAIDMWRVFPSKTVGLLFTSWTESLVDIICVFCVITCAMAFYSFAKFPAEFSWSALCVFSLLPGGFSPPVIRLISFTWPSLTCPQLYLINKCPHVLSFLPVLVSCWVLSHSFVSLNRCVCCKFWILGVSLPFFNGSASIRTKTQSPSFLYPKSCLTSCVTNRALQITTSLFYFLTHSCNWFWKINISFVPLFFGQRHNHMKSGEKEE